jgi:hypothetical protein
MARNPRTSAPMPLPSLAKVSLPASTCSYHLTKLLNAGITVCRADGTLRLPVLRREDLDNSFPGLLDLVRQGTLSSAQDCSGLRPRSRGIVDEH